jgi:uncharacterized protein YigE (DUF2233 family)
MRARIAFVAALIAAAPAVGADAPCAEQTFEGSRFTVCPVDTKAHVVEIAWADAAGMPYRAFHIYAEQNDTKTVRFAMNAGMFHADGSSVGLLKIDGRQIQKLSTTNGPGNFHMKPNGVFFVTAGGTVGIAPTDEFAKGTKADGATQSGPMLVIGGGLHPSFQSDGPSRLIRNGVGVRGPDKAFFAISEDPVSFGKFARLFRDALDCKDALYFDGTVSSLWVPSQSREDTSVPFGPMIVVRDKPPPRPAAKQQ